MPWPPRQCNPSPSCRKPPRPPPRRRHRRRRRRRRCRRSCSRRHRSARRRPRRQLSSWQLSPCGRPRRYSPRRTCRRPRRRHCGSAWSDFSSAASSRTRPQARPRARPQARLRRRARRTHPPTAWWTAAKKAALVLGAILLAQAGRAAWSSRLRARSALRITMPPGAGTALSLRSPGARGVGTTIGPRHTRARRHAPRGARNHTLLTCECRRTSYDETRNTNVRLAEVCYGSVDPTYRSSPQTPTALIANKAP